MNVAYAAGRKRPIGGTPFAIAGRIPTRSLHVHPPRLAEDRRRFSRSSLFPFLAQAAPPDADLKAVVDKAVKFLTTAQKDAGNFSANPRGGEPGLTALIAAALVRNGVAADNAVVAKALKYLETKIKKDGGVYEQGLSNYMTSLAIVAFKETNAGGKYDKVIDAAVEVRPVAAVR